METNLLITFECWGCGVSDWRYDVKIQGFFIIALALALVLTGMGGLVSVADAKDDVRFRVLFNGVEISYDENSGFPLRGERLFPLRRTLEAVGIAVDYDSEAECVSATQERLSVIFYVGSDENSGYSRVTHLYGGSAKLENGRSYAILDTWFWDLFGYEAVWAEDGGSVEIKRIRRAAYVPYGWHAVSDVIGVTSGFYQEGERSNLGLDIQLYANESNQVPESSLPRIGLVNDDTSGERKCVVILRPVELRYQLFRISEGKEELIFTYDYPAFDGSIPPMREYWFSLHVPEWEKIDFKTGNYKAVVSIPETFTYCYDNDPTVRVTPANRIRGGTVWEFKVV